jgi:hypothetical protein
MKTRTLFLSTLLSLTVLVLLSQTAVADGGGGGGGAGETSAHRDARHHHHAHSAAPGAQNAGTQAGQQFGFQQNAQGNYDTANRVIINNTTEAVLDKSAAIDNMLAADAIAPEGWMMLKSAMAQSMESAADDQETSPEIQNTANGGEANGSGATSYVDTAIPNSNAAASPAGTADGLSTENYSGSAVSSPAAITRNSDSNSGNANSPSTAPVFNAFVLPLASSSNGTASNIPSAGPSLAAQAAAIKQAPQAIGLSASGANGFTSARDQHTLALAQALAGKRNGEPASDVTKAPVKKKSGFPDPIRAIFGKTKPKYAHTSPSKSSLLNNTVEKSGMTLALPAQDSVATQAAIEEEEDESNWTLLFLMAMGMFGSLAALYVVWKRPRKSIVQLMVPGSGEHFTIRPGDDVGQYILDIKDARGNLVRSAGMLRPQSVARAAVLPPTLAAQLGAQGSFDRFEFTEEGEFRRTSKEEGYQIFPFILSKAA